MSSPVWRVVSWYTQWLWAVKWCRTVRNFLKCLDVALGHQPQCPPERNKQGSHGSEQCSLLPPAAPNKEPIVLVQVVLVLLPFLFLGHVVLFLQLVNRWFQITFQRWNGSLGQVCIRY